MVVLGGKDRSTSTHNPSSKRALHAREARLQRCDARGQAERHCGDATLVKRRADILRAVVVRIAQVSGVRHHDCGIAGGR
jgi:hypothetical protein